MSVATLTATLKAAYADLLELAIAYVDQLKESAEKNDSTILAHEAIMADLMTANQAVGDAALALKEGYPTVTVDDIDYDIMLPEVLVDGAVLTAEDIEELGEDSDLAISMVAGNSDVLRKHKPTAEFSADDTSVLVDVDVTFTDESVNEPTSWGWNFGDGEISTEQNPVHAYAEAGSYTVALTATNEGGSDTETKTTYIVVSAS